MTTNRTKKTLVTALAVAGVILLGRAVASLGLAAVMGYLTVIVLGVLMAADYRIGPRRLFRK